MSNSLLFHRNLQSRLMDISISDLNSDVSRGRAFDVVVLTLYTDERIYPPCHKRKCVPCPHVQHAVKYHLTCLSAFDTRAVMASGRKLHLYLISRRSRYRAGTRYFRRGVDHDGHVANFNETEQIATVPSQADPNDAATTLSFVQIRGSVPIFWSEINTLRYKPDLQIMDLPDSVIISLE